MTLIQPYLTQVTNFTVAGFNVRTKNENEFNPNTAKIPHLWSQLHAEKVAQQATRVFGVYSQYESDVTGAYTLTAGVEIDGSFPPGFESVEIKTGDYLVFENKGPMPTAIIEAWQRVWQYFQDQPMYPRAYQTDFEVYQGTEKCAIYIGVLITVQD